MVEVVTLVTGVVSPDGLRQIADVYGSAVAGGLPQGIEETFLLEADGGRVAVLSKWRRRSDLDAMLASGEEPFARRLIREAGGAPEATIYSVVERAGGSDRTPDS